ncbi:MAG: SHOCT domain-containing protein [Planctomycetota bacterium]
MALVIDLLAQQKVQEHQQQILFWLVVIVIVSVVLGVGAMLLLRRMRAEQKPGPSLGFTLADLREMHAQGQLSDREFETAKAKMLARTRRQIDEDDQKRAAGDRIQPPEEHLDELAPADEDAPDPTEEKD